MRFIGSQLHGYMKWLHTLRIWQKSIQSHNARWSVADEHEEPKKQLSRVAEGPKSHKSKSWCPSGVKKVTRGSDQEDHGRRPREWSVYVFLYRVLANFGWCKERARGRFGTLSVADWSAHHMSVAGQWRTRGGERVVAKGSSGYDYRYDWDLSVSNVSAAMWHAVVEVGQRAWPASVTHSSYGKERTQWKCAWHKCVMEWCNHLIKARRIVSSDAIAS